MRKLILILVVIVSNFLMINQIALANQPLNPQCPEMPLFNGNPIKRDYLDFEYLSQTRFDGQKLIQEKILLCKYKLEASDTICPSSNQFTNPFANPTEQPRDNSKAAISASYDPKKNEWRNCQYHNNY